MAVASALNCHGDLLRGALAKRRPWHFQAGSGNAAAGLELLKAENNFPVLTRSMIDSPPEFGRDVHNFDFDGISASSAQKWYASPLGRSSKMRKTMVTKPEKKWEVADQVNALPAELRVLALARHCLDWALS